MKLSFLRILGISVGKAMIVPHFYKTQDISIVMKGMRFHLLDPMGVFDGELVSFYVSPI